MSPSKIVGFNDIQNRTIEQFRERVLDILNSNFEKSDAFLSRWLIPRNFELAKAEMDLRQSVTWRRDCWELTPLEDELKNRMSKLFKFSMGREMFDREGRPITVLSIGDWQVKSFIATEPDGKQKMVKYVVQLFDEMSEQCKDRHEITNGQAHQLTVICDMEGFSFKQLTSTGVISVAIELVKTLETHYPCMFYRAFVVNAPTIAKVMLGAVRPFIRQESKDKLKVFNSDKEKWEEALSEDIDMTKLKLSWQQ